jgi:hypothetical protein
MKWPELMAVPAFLILPLKLQAVRKEALSKLDHEEHVPQGLTVVVEPQIVSKVHLFLINKYHSFYADISESPSRVRFSTNHAFFGKGPNLQLQG